MTPTQTRDALEHKLAELIDACCRTPNYVSRIADLRNDILAALPVPGDGEPAGFRCRHKKWPEAQWNTIYHRSPDSYELRECDIENVYLAPPPAVPAGFVLVPVEPTPDMCIDGGIAWSEATFDPRNTAADAAAAGWKAMLAARPDAPAGEKA